MIKIELIIVRILNFDVMVFFCLSYFFIVIATGYTLEEITKHWNYLEKSLLPTLCKCNTQTQPRCKNKSLFQMSVIKL